MASDNKMIILLNPLYNIPYSIVQYKIMKQKLQQKKTKQTNKETILIQ